MQYCLVEDLNQNITLPKDCIYIALTIDASYKLDKLGIEYTLLENFYNQRDVCGDTNAYLYSQLDWFNSFDELVKNIYIEAKTLNINLPILYFYNIKYLVDQVILSARILQKFLDVAKPQKIYFVSQNFGEDDFDRWHWFYNGESSFSRLIEPICEKKNIEIEKIIISVNADKNISYFSMKVIIAEFKKFIPKSIKSRIKRFLNTIEIGVSSRSAQNKNILILKTRDYVQDFCKDAVNSCYKIKYFSDTNFNKKKKSSFYEPKYNNSDLFKDTDLINWINNQCDIDVYPIIKNRFNYLINNTFPQTITLIKYFIKLYEEQNIKFVLNYSLSTEVDFAAAIAAKISSSTKSVGFYHGMDAFDAPHRFFMEFAHFDIYFASTKGEVDHIRKLSKKFSQYGHPVVNEYTYLRNKIMKSFIKKESLPSRRSGKQIVLYIPIMRKIRLNMPIDYGIPLTMFYIKWHKSLISYFNKRTDFRFIWKAYLQPNFNYDPIQEIIKESNSTNITFSDGNLKSWLARADRVICDVPSAAFFEACFAGKPVIAFYNPDEQRLRDNAYDTFGSSLRSYSSFEEGLNIVEEILDNDPEQYIVNLNNLKQSDISVCDILHSH